jgi:hypothetical protein
MEIGTAETIEDPIRTETPSSALSCGPGPSGNGGGGNNPGGDDDGRTVKGSSSAEPFRPGSRAFDGISPVVVLMTFGGLVAAYIVIATNNVAEWRPFALPIQVWISTFLILVSSVTYHIAKTAVDKDAQHAAKGGLLSQRLSEPRSFPRRSWLGSSSRPAASIWPGIHTRDSFSSSPRSTLFTYWEG